jgi:hypothetical protein
MICIGARFQCMEIKELVVQLELVSFHPNVHQKEPSRVRRGESNRRQKAKAGKPAGRLQGRVQEDQLRPRWLS